MPRSPVQLGPKQETLLIPLLARAYETKRSDPLLEDPKAVEIVSNTEYDFDKWPDTFSLRMAMIRTLILDEDVSCFIEKHPNGVIVEVGCGLNTRFERLDNGRITWYDLDLPDVITMRRKYFDDTERRTMIAASFADSLWYDQVRPKDKSTPICFVCESSIIYIERDLVLSAITSVSEAFENVTFITDVTGSRMVNQQQYNPLMNVLSPESYFIWKCDDPREIERCTNHKWKLIKSRSMFQTSDIFWTDAPLPFRLIRNYLHPSLIDILIGKYSFNVYQSSN